MRFPRSGTNWEGRSWTLHPAVAALASQIEETWPERHRSDGTIASRAHDDTNPNSDHRPYPYSGPGVVHALDMGEVTEDDGILLAEQLRKARDPRLKYLIHEGRIFSSYSNSRRNSWQWGTYTGSNPHTSHVHVSVYRDAGGGEWAITLREDDMADHEHTPMPDELPRSWADDGWDEWVDRTGTKATTRGHTLYREDMGWIYERVILPLEREVSRLAAELDALSGTDHNHDARYVRRGTTIELP